MTIWSVLKLFNTAEIAGATNKTIFCTHKWQNLSKFFAVRLDHGPTNYELQVSKLKKLFCWFLVNLAS